MNSVQVLQAALALLVDPTRWTQRALARNEFGDEERDPRSVDATQWCVFGALTKVTTEADLPAVIRAEEALERVGCTGTSWNDAPERTHNQVLVAIERALIAEVKGKRSGQ